MRTGRSRAPAWLRGRKRGEWNEGSGTNCATEATCQFSETFGLHGGWGTVGGSVVSRVKAEGKSFPPRPRAAPGQADSRVCTPCTGGQIAGAAGSQAGLSRTGGADPGRPGGTHRSGGTNARVCDEREPVSSLSAPPLPSHAPDCPDTPVAQLITLLHSVGSPAVTPGGSFHLTMALGYGGTSVPRGPQTCPHARPTAPPFTPSLSGTAARCTDRRCSSSDAYSRSRLLSSSSSSPPAAPFPCAVAAGREPPSLAPHRCSSSQPRGDAHPGGTGTSPPPWSRDRTAQCCPTSHTSQMQTRA